MTTTDTYQALLEAAREAVRLQLLSRRDRKQRGLCDVSADAAC
jgi:hypothetical protein